MNIWLAILATAALSSLMTMLGIYLVYRWRIKPGLDARVMEIKLQVDSLEQRVAAGVHQGIKESLRDFSDRAMLSTTRSVARMGADLVEGGLSAFLNERGRKGDKGRGET